MSIQIKKKFLRSQSVDGSKVLFLNEDSFKALKSDGSEAPLFKLDSNNNFQLLEMPRVSADPSHANELARKLYVDAGDALEAAARAAADAAEQAAREAEDTAIRSEFAAADALVLIEAKDYADNKVAEEAAFRSAEDAEIREEFAAADLIEKTQREAADQLLRDDLDAEIARALAAEAAESATRASEDVRVLSESKAYTDAEVLEEKTRAMAREAELQSEIDAEEVLRASEDARVLSESKAYTDAEVLEEKTRAMAAEAAIQAELDAEEALRASEDVRVLSEAKTYTDEEVLEEKTRAMAREAELQAELDAEEALRASEDVRILSESKAYTDSSIASVIDAAPEAYNTLREIAEYIASDQTATSQILSQLYDHETRLDVIEGTGEGSIAKAEADAMAYTDAEKTRAMAREAELQSEIDAEESLRASEDVRVLSEAKTYTDAEKTRAMGQEAAIRSEFAAADAAIVSDLEDLDGYAQDIRSDLEDLDGYAQDIRSDLDQEIIDRIADVDAEEARAMAAEAAETAARIAADSAEAALRASEDVRILGEAKAYTDAEVLTEKTRAMGVEASLQSEIDAEETLRASEDIRILSESKAYTDTEVLTEKTRAMGVEASLQSEIDAEEVLRASEDVRVLGESKAYTDQKVAAVIDSAPEMLDTLRELAQALGNDENFATSVTGYIATAKEEAKDYAEAQVDAFGERLVIEAFEVTSTMISDNFIELQHKAFTMSIVASVDRLMMLEQEDYEVSVQNGKTRLTFDGSMLQGQEEALAIGDKIRVRYLKDVRS